MASNSPSVMTISVWFGFTRCQPKKPHLPPFGKRRCRPLVVIALEMKVRGGGGDVRGR
jgi:hypothetical protein